MSSNSQRDRRSAVPYLDIRPDELGPRRSRLTLAKIEKVMLWPDDPNQQERTMRAAEAEYFPQWVLSTVAHADDPIMLSKQDYALMFGRIRDAPRLTELWPKAKGHFFHGHLAGEILLGVLTTGGSIEVIKTDIAKLFRDKPNYKHLSRKTIDNTVWGTYSPVAHLWAASLARAHAFPIGSPRPFPCRLDDLEKFLALAERLRVDAENTKIGGGRWLLNSQATWKVPEDLVLPPVIRIADAKSSKTKLKKIFLF